MEEVKRAEWQSQCFQFFENNLIKGGIHNAFYTKENTVVLMLLNFYIET